MQTDRPDDGPEAAPFESFAELIELWPTAVVFAEDLRIKPVTARAWKVRGIPSEYWQDVVTAASRRGLHRVSYEAMAGLAARRRPLSGYGLRSGVADVWPVAGSGR